MIYLLIVIFAKFLLLAQETNVGIANTMFTELAKNNINIQVISTSEIKISVLISSGSKKIALNALHKVYGLDKSFD